MVEIETKVTLMIRLAETHDLETLDALSEKTILHMHQNNLHQWTLAYPRKAHFSVDIEERRLYVYERRGKILGLMALYEENEDSYRELIWHHRESLVMHRVIVDPDARGQGIGGALIDYAITQCKKQCKPSLKIDTHPANHTMNHLLKKHAFQYVGYLKSIHRLAYERIIDHSFMKKVLVLGGPGSGKSTFSKKLGQKLSLPVLHLDQLAFDKGFTLRSHATFKKHLDAYIRRAGRFVIDGNYTSFPSFDRRLALADTIILLNFPASARLKGIMQRHHRNRNKQRDDAADGCIETIDQEFLGFTAFYDIKNKKLRGMLNALRHRKHVLVFNTRADLMRWFNNL